MAYIPRIVLSYRREDTSGYARSLNDRLSYFFGADRVFRDIDDIPSGSDYLQHIDTVLGQCDVLVVIMGERWLEVEDRYGRRRLDDPRDVVCYEVGAALERNIPVIPVLVPRGEMPREEELPDRIKNLARRNGLHITDSHWDYDCEQLRLAIVREAERARGPGMPSNPFGTPQPPVGPAGGWGQPPPPRRQPRPPRADKVPPPAHQPGQPIDRLAISAVVIAVIGLLLVIVPALACVVSILALILASAAERRITASNGDLGGSGQVKVSRITAALAIGVAIVVALA